MLQYIGDQSCYQSIKDKNFESNSQLNLDEWSQVWSCYQSIKDKNFKETAYLCVKDNVALVIVSRQAQYEDDEAALFSF